MSVKLGFICFCFYNILQSKLVMDNRLIVSPVMISICCDGVYQTSPLPPLIYIPPCSHIRPVLNTFLATSLNYLQLLFNVWATVPFSALVLDSCPIVAYNSDLCIWGELISRKKPWKNYKEPRKWKTRKK